MARPVRPELVDSKPEGRGLPFAPPAKPKEKSTQEERWSRKAKPRQPQPLQNRRPLPTHRRCPAVRRLPRHRHRLQPGRTDCLHRDRRASLPYRLWQNHLRHQSCPRKVTLGVLPLQQAAPLIPVRKPVPSFRGPLERPIPSVPSEPLPLRLAALPAVQQRVVETALAALVAPPFPAARTSERASQPEAQHLHPHPFALLLLHADQKDSARRLPKAAHFVDLPPTSDCRKDSAARRHRREEPNPASAQPRHRHQRELALAVSLENHSRE